MHYSAARGDTSITIGNQCYTMNPGEVRGLLNDCIASLLQSNQDNQGVRCADDRSARTSPAFHAIICVINAIIPKPEGRT